MIICGLRKNIKKVNRNICRTRKSKCKSKDRKEVIQMKRKLDPNKIYAFIGRAVVYSSLYIGTVLFGMWAFCQNTIY